MGSVMLLAIGEVDIGRVTVILDSCIYEYKNALQRERGEEGAREREREREERGGEREREGEGEGKRERLVI